MRRGVRFGAVVLIGALGFAPCSWSATCFKIGPDNAKLTWTGYKKHEKVPVKGSFSKVSFQSKEQASSLKELLESITFTVDTNTISSGDLARDENLKNNVFNLKSLVKDAMALPEITGAVKSFDEKAKKAKAELKLNKETVVKEFDVKQDGKTLTFTSELDLINDFKMVPYMRALSEACKGKEMHDGKTWAKVGLEVVATYSDECPKK